ncbi:hypothetical protein E3G67_004639 [Mycobacteroides abscessus]|nr:hypothetical protein [Mycobacteroides abscessus]
MERVAAVVGRALPAVPRLEVVEGKEDLAGTPTWILRGVTSNLRYTRQDEAVSLAARQEPLGRAPATRAALIPITKSDAWWQLAQDARREILEESSHHIAVGLEYLPAIARRLHHGRDLGAEFDFLTWFEYRPEDSDAFEDLVHRLRKTPEWTFIAREIDIRLSR